MTTAPTGPTGPASAAGVHHHLDGHHRHTLERIFAHPTSHNIQWHDVRSLLERVGSVTEHDDGRFVVGIGDNIETFDPGGGRDLDIDHVVMLRRFLTADGITPEGVKKG